MQISNSEEVPVGKESPQALVEQEAVAPAVKRRPVVLATRPEALSAKPNLMGLLVALRRRWLLAVSLGVLIAPAVAVTVWIMRPITFTARFTLYVKSSAPKVLYDVQEARIDFNNYQRAQIALVKSRLVLNTALRDEKVAKLPIVQQEEDQVMWLEKEIQADFNVAPEILRISMTGEDAKAVGVIVTAVQEAYLSEIVQKESAAREDRLKELKRYFADYDEKLREKRELLKRMARQAGSQNPKVLAMNQEFSAQHLRELQSELLKRESELRTAQLELAAQMARDKQSVDIPVPDRIVEEQIKLDPVVIRLQKDAAQHELDLAGFKERSPAPEKEPGYKKAMQALDATKAALEKRREELRPTIVQQMRDRVQDDQRVLAKQVDNRVKFLIDLKGVLENEIEARSKKADAYKLNVVDLEWLQNEIAQQETVNKDLAKQMQALEIEAKAPSRVTRSLDTEVVVIPAQTESSRLRLAGGAGLGSFLAVLFGIAFLEFRLRRVNHADEVVQGLKMKLVGSLPLVPRRALLGRASAARNMEWQNRLTESVDAIRTTLLNAARFEGLRRVMVTSAVGGEGKTLLSCHLAVSLARAGCKTLLIDGDLRRPSVHKMFGLPVANGLSELLRGQAAPTDVTNAGPLESLSVITAGESDNRAIQTLSSERLGDLMRQLSESYEFVVIDSAPVLPVADAQLIGQHVDGVVFSVMRDVSRLPTVYAACERLTLLRIRILGAVVNGMQGNYYQSSPYYSSPVPAEAAKPAEKRATV
jgi:capsular exopolysaccharide synthesis family protein